MVKLDGLLGAMVLLVGCGSAPVGAPTSAPASIGATLAPQPPVVQQPTVMPSPTTASAPSDAPSASPAGDVTGSADEKITVGDYQYITMLDAEYSTEGYTEFFKPDEGNAIYAFELEFEGLDPSGSSYNPLYFDLDVAGTEYQTSFLGGKEPTLGSGELQPGATASGWVSFNAPLADEITLRYEPVLGLEGNAVEWLVTVRP